MEANAITPFLFEGEKLIRVVERDGNPWFVAHDLCAALGLKNPSRTTARLPAGHVALHTLKGDGPAREVQIVSEPGFYTVALRCQGALEEGTVAFRFREWVTGQVLPAIRKTGGYRPAAEAVVMEPHREAEDSVSLKVRMVTECRQTFGERAAGQLWLKLGLIVVAAMFHDPRQGDLLDMAPRPGHGGEEGSAGAPG